MNFFLQILQNYLVLGIVVYQYLLLLYILASWVGGLPKNAIGEFLHGLIMPLIRLCQRVPHQLGPFDISAAYAFILLRFLESIVLRI